MTKRFGYAVLAFCSTLIPANSAKATDEDFQLWQVTTLTTGVAEGVTGHFEVQPRFTDDASRLGQLLVRPSIGFALGNGYVLSAGYAYVRTSPSERPVTHEHRPWQQLAFPLAGGSGGVLISNRSRIEQRFRDDGDDVGLRLRQQFRVEMPTAFRDWKFVAWTEAFLNLNDTDWGQRSGLDRWRNFAGFNIPIGPRIALEPGYINQYVHTVASDAMDHVLSVTMQVKF